MGGGVGPADRAGTSVPSTLWFQAVAKACGDAARVPAGRTPADGGELGGAVDDVDASVVAGAVVTGSVDDVEIGLVGRVVEGAVVDVDVDGSVVDVVVDGSVVAGSVVAGSVVAGSVSDGDDGVVGTSVEGLATGVVGGWVGAVPLSSASWVTMRRTAALWV